MFHLMRYCNLAENTTHSIGVGAGVVLTGHVHHPAVAVLHDVARFTVDPAGGYAVDLEEARLQSFGLALSPWGRQVGQLEMR